MAASTSTTALFYFIAATIEYIHLISEHTVCVSTLRDVLLFAAAAFDPILGFWRCCMQILRPRLNCAQAHGFEELCFL